MTPFPVPDPPVSDGVVSLRPLEPHDAVAIAEACRDPLIPRFTFMAENLTPERATEWIARRNEQWERGEVAGFAIIEAGDDQCFVGTVGLGVNVPRFSGEVFYWIASHARRRGWAVRAVRLISAWAFDDLALERLEILTHPENEASQRVAVAGGYRYEGTLRSHQPFKGSRMDSVLFSLIPADLGKRSSSP